MKKSASPEQNRIRPPRVGGVGETKTPAPATAKGAKLSPSPGTESVGLLEEHFSNSEAHTATFEYFNPEAREVFLAGSFNGWQPRAMTLTKQRGGKWSGELLLKPGDYEYRFVVDGQWQDDPMAARFVANSFGGLNSVVRVAALPV